MQHLSFSKLKGVFPGRITLLRKNPETTESDTGNASANGDAIKASSRSPSDEELNQASAASPAPAETGPPASPSPGNTDSASPPPPSYADSRWKKFETILAQNVVDLVKLQEAAWTGIPHKLRPVCWRLLLGYEPPNRERAVATVKRKRREYQELVPAYFDIDNMERNDDELAEIKQVSVDVPRTAPEIPFFQQPHMQHVLRRLLYIWGIRHPASGYVQGINDLSTPFMAVFLSEYLEGDISSWQCTELSEAQLLDAEADTYWCLCKLVERVQDVYTTGQPGIQRCLFQLEELVSRVDAALAEQLQRENVSYYQFAFRWINCLLIREVPFSVAIRLWDTYLAEGMRFGEFLPYACAAFLLHWSKQLQTMEFQDILLFLQKVPTSSWRGKDLEVVLSHAHMLRTSFDDAQSHLLGGVVNGSR